EERIEQIIGVAAEERSGKSYDLVCAGSKRSQSVALGRIACELVNLVTDGVIEPAGHVSPDEFNRRHAVNLLSIGLAHRAVSLSTGLFLPCLDRLGDLNLSKIGNCEAIAINNYGLACIGIDYATEAWT